MAIQKLWIHGALFVTYNISTLSESLKTGLSIRTWWNTQKMMRITAMSAWFFGFLAIILKKLRISEPIFEITKKEQSSTSFDGANQNSGRFSFNESPIFLPSTTILFVQLIALVSCLFGWAQHDIRSGLGYGLGEVLCSAYLVACHWPFLRGLFGNGKHGIPLSTMIKSAMLAFLFVHFCKLTIMV
jgi:hypothetical protein